MAYQALYRKWRPRIFDDVIGQSSITDTLKNSIKRNKISHAFLFSGPRGTGKTSCAKIFAKALNCTDVKDGEPCNKCVNCLASDAGTMSDIIEIDAASNNGVDEIREIRDKVKYAPTQGNFKVYIIDEVHMLSMGAFNALLKTLEEPPEHVVFILATTELQKVPSTIISRTQRYNFKRINIEDLILRMKYILEQEKVSFDEKALSVIAYVADGGMRDSLSILDQILSYDQDKVGYQDTLKITGFADQGKVEQLFVKLLGHETNEALNQVNALLSSGASSKNILNELIELSVKSMLLIQGKESEQFISNDFEAKVKKAQRSQFYQIVKLANTAINDLRYTNQQRIPLEIFVVQATNSDSLNVTDTKKKSVSSNSIEQLEQKFNNLEQKFKKIAGDFQTAKRANNSFSGSLKEPASFKEESTGQSEKKEKKVLKNQRQTPIRQDNNRKQVYHVLESATKQDIAKIKDIWPDLMSTLEVSQRAVLEVLEPVAASSNQVVLKCKYELWFERAIQDNDLVDKLQDMIEKLTNNYYEIVLVADSSWLQVRKDFLTSHKETLLAQKQKKMESSDNSNQDDSTNLVSNKDNQVIDKAKELFGDLAQIKE